VASRRLCVAMQDVSRTVPAAMAILAAASRIKSRCVFSEFHAFIFFDFFWCCEHDPPLGGKVQVGWLLAAPEAPCRITVYYKMTHFDLFDESRGRPHARQRAAHTGHSISHSHTRGLVRRTYTVDIPDW
jgi:hypothetical protein